MALEDAKATLGWAMVLPVCEQPTDDLPSHTRLHRLLMSLLGIHEHAEPPLHACLQEDLRVTTLQQLQPMARKAPQWRGTAGCLGTNTRGWTSQARHLVLTIAAI